MNSSAVVRRSETSRRENLASVARTMVSIEADGV